MMKHCMICGSENNNNNKHPTIKHAVRIVCHECNNEYYICMKCYGTTARQGAVLNQDNMIFKDKIIMKRYFKKQRIVEEKKTMLREKKVNCIIWKMEI